MTHSLENNLSQILPLQADILQPFLIQFSHLQVSHLNFFYADWQEQTLTSIGTEVGWLQHCMEQRLFEHLPLRFTPWAHLWEANSDWYHAYQQYLERRQLPTSFLKTDICFEGNQGLYLLEIAHERPLNLYEMNPFFECIGFLIDENRRLQKQHPELKRPFSQPIGVPNPPEPPSTACFDLNQIEEADPIALDSLEAKALILRLQWLLDDEIAQQLQLSLTEVRQLFASIANKHHHPYIPPSVYQRYLPHVLKHFIMNTDSKLL